MESRHVIYIVIGWLAVNVVFPLFLKSVDRLYEKQIDRCVAGVFRATKWFLLMLLRVFLIILTLPTIVLVIIFERVWPRIFHIRYFAEIQYSMNLLFKRQFADVIVRDLKKFRQQKDLTEDKSNK